MPALEVVKAYNNPSTLLQDIHSLEFDLCILDIEMPLINGTQLAAQLNGVPVIFVTAYKQFAAEAFDLDAVDYIVKPLKKERLQQAISKAAYRISNRGKIQLSATFNSDHGKTIVYFDQLQFISSSEIDSRDKCAHLQNGSVITLKNISFDRLLQLLPRKQFIRVNKKEILSKRIIHSYTQTEIVTRTSDEDKPLKFSLTDVYRSSFSAWIAD